MTQDEIRQLENRVITESLRDIEDPDILAFLASLIDGHDFLRHKLMTEPNKRIRREKLDCMRPYLKFRALSCEAYEIAELAKSCGVQPIYQEQEDAKRIIPAPSFLHEVR